MLPLTPILVLGGRPTIEPVETLEPTPGDQAAFRVLDAAAYGFDRTVDHGLWADLSEGATVWVRDGEPVAYSYRNQTGIGPVAGADSESAAQALQAELARSADREITIFVPGSSSSLLEIALRSHLRLEDPGLLLTSGGLATLPSSIAIHSYWLL